MRPVVCILGFLLLFTSIGYAEENTAAVSDGELLIDTDEEQPTRVQRVTKGKRRVEKKAEGTEAKKNLQVNTLPKSKYTINGRQVEVDSD